MTTRGSEANYRLKGESEQAHYKQVPFEQARALAGKVSYMTDVVNNIALGL
ncbi:MAG: hypothetical protein WD273_13790 [Trueperaceae bacterium]